MACTALVLAATAGRTQEGRPDLADAAGALITGVELRGVDRVDAEELRASLATRPSECRGLLYRPFCWFSNSETFVDPSYLEPMEVRRDEARIALYYWMRGMRNASASAHIESDDDGVRVVFDVAEGPVTRIRELEVTQTDSVLSPDAIAEAMEVEAGDAFDIVALDSSVAHLYDALWDEGYADAVIDVDTSTVVDTSAAPDSADATRSALVQLLVRPMYRTRVAHIEIIGNDEVSERSIRRLLALRPGMLYRRQAVIESQRNLILSGLFRTAEIVLPAPGDSLKRIEVHVVEGDLHRLDLGAGFNSVDYAQLDAQFTRLNFLGETRRLSVSATVGNLLAEQLGRLALFDDRATAAEDNERFQRLTWQGSVTFTQPWFFDRRNDLTASVFGHRSSVPGIVIDRGYGARVGVTRTLAPRATATLGYSYESSSVDAGDVYFCVTFGVCVGSTIRALAARHTLSPVSLVGQIDRADDPLVPTEGYRARIGIEHASAVTASDFRYSRIAAEGSAYLPLSRTTVLAGRLRLGWVEAIAGTDDALGIPGLPAGGVVHPRKRFFAGGSRSVRGFGENQLGPRILTISPAALTDTTLANPCTTAELASGACNPNIAGLASTAFQPQPLGGTVLADVSAEYRFRITEILDGAVFLDGALIGTDTFRELLGATGAITPGVGVRLGTPIGPVRLDLGFRPRLVENLPVITEVTGEDGTTRLVRLDARRRYDPTDQSGGAWRQIFERLTLHLAVGPAF